MPQKRYTNNNNYHRLELNWKKDDFGTDPGQI